MNKNRMILSIAGGAIGVIVLAMAYLAWSAMAAKTAAIEGDDEEGTAGLETIEAKAQSLSHQSIYPSAESVKAIEANAEQVQAWENEAFKLVSRGDKVFPTTTSAAFKTFLVSDAKRLSMLPGAGNGTLIKEDFTFGPFREYIVEGKMPADTMLVQLQRQWDDVASVIELLSAAGAVQLTDVQFKAKAAPAVEEPKQNVRKPNNKKAKAKAAPTVEVREPLSYTYQFTFTARPTGFVKALNLLGIGERFAVVEDFSLQHPNDTLAVALGGEVKQQDNRSAGRGRRGRRAVVEEVKKPEDDEAKKGIVTDPILDEPFTVAMTVTVYDFRSLEEAQKSEEGK